MDAIILAGGKGTRLGGDIPKALVKLKGKPIIGYQLDYLLKSGRIESIILSLGYKLGELWLGDSLVQDNPLAESDIMKNGQDQPGGGRN